MAVFDFFSLPAVGIAFVMHMMMGAIWYSLPVFGKPFLRLAFPKRKTVEPDPMAMVAASIGTAIAMPFYCLLLSVAGVRSAGEGALWGAALGIFFDERPHGRARVERTEARHKVAVAQKLQGVFIMAMFDYLSLPAVCISWMLYMGIASVWYSPLMFRQACVTLAHGDKDRKLSKPGMIASALGTAFAMPFFCFILSVAGCRSAVEGALWGASFGLFFDTGLNCSHPFFEARPFALFLIHSGCHALSLTVIGAVLGQLCA